MRHGLFEVLLLAIVNAIGAICLAQVTETWLATQRVVMSDTASITLGVLITLTMIFTPIILYTRPHKSVVLNPNGKWPGRITIHVVEYPSGVEQGVYYAEPDEDCAIWVYPLGETRHYIAGAHHLSIIKREADA